MQPMVMSRNRGEVRWEWIGDAWKLFADNPGTWIAMMFISIVVAIIAIFLPTFIFLIPAGIFASGDRSGAGIFALAGSVLLALVAIAVISLLVTSYLTAGFYRAAIKQVRGEAISAGDLFSASDSFPGVLGVMVLITLADIVLLVISVAVAAVSEELSVLFSIFRVIIRLVAAGFLFYSIPLIVDSKAGVIDSIKMSISATLSQWWMYVIFVLVLAVIVFIGVIPCGLGLFVTMPLYILASAAAYRDTFITGGVQSYDRFATPPPPPSYQTTPAPPNYQAIPQRPQFSNPPQPQFSNPPDPTPLHSQETQLIGRTCPTCGATLTRTANFCNQCGSQLQSS